MKTAATLSTAVALLSGTADAFFRMQCHQRTTLARLDPIVDPGVASSHGHTIHGGSNFGESTTYEDLRASDCTSCAFEDDRSAYWTPSLHFVHENGKTEVVPQVGGMLAYYLLLGENIKAFPPGFQMLAGDSRLRNFTGQVPDKPTSVWDAEDMTQLALGQKSLGFNCLNYAKPAEGSRFRHFLPDKAYMDENCADGIRAEIFFPSCWNGETTAKDHKSHVAYPNLIDGGVCPEGYDQRLPSLFYETIWDTNHFNGKPGQFTFSNGDPTGCGYHADFMNGWDQDTLQAAVEQCTNESGRVEDCPVFNNRLQSEFKQGMCKIQDKPRILSNDNCEGPAEGLCGNVPVQYGPGYANVINPGQEHQEPTKAPEMTQPAPVPTLSYASARSEGVGGISVYNVDPAPSIPAVTPAPEYTQDVGIISTTTYTSAGTVYEVAIKEVQVTVTVEAAYKKARRHADAHRRGMFNHY